MAIQRVVRRSEVAPGRMRYRVLITGEECPPRTHEARQHFYLFIKWLDDNQTLMECGYSIPDKVVVTHNGTCWQAECEAEVEEQTGG